jgi:hypothetical protein
MKKYLVLTLTLIFLGIIPLLTSIARAEDKKPAVWLQISPVSQKITVNPGDERDYELTVENIGSENLHFRVYVAPYNVSGENYDLNFTEETARTQITRWITFDQAEYDLKVGEKQLVKYHISVPEDVPDGGQYATIFAESNGDNEQTETDSSGIKTVSRIGMIIYARIGGETREGMTITDFSLPTFYFSGSSKIVATSTVKNAGNTDFEAKYYLTIKSFFGDMLYDRSESHQILPESERKVELLWEDTPSMGIFNANYRVEIPSDSKETSHLILVIPPFLLIIVFVIIVLAVIWIIIKVRRTRELKSRLSASTSAPKTKPLA